MEAIPPAWGELLEAMGAMVSRVEQERDRYAVALERSTSELRELMVELDALRQARSAAESANMVRGEILAKVSRTMRAPSDAILGLTNLLRSGALLPSQRAYVEAVHGAGETLRGLLNDVADFSRLEAGTLPLEPIPFDLRVMVEDLSSALGTQAEAKGLHLRVLWRADAPRRVTGDPGRIRQVLAAMVGDAMARMSHGEISIEVASGSLNLPGGGSRFVVADTGPPIPADLLPTLFEPFSRSDVYHSREGSLALPIARQLSVLMGGEMDAANLPGLGTRFTVSLPLAPSDDGSPNPVVAHIVQAEAPLVESGHEPVLVVEADADLRGSLAAIAEGAGYSAVQFEERDEAVREVARLSAAGHPAAAVIFSDHAADGYEELGRTLLDQDREHFPALLMLPAVGHPGDARRLKEAGFLGYLVKPVTQTDLREVLLTLRRIPRSEWDSLFLTRHSLAEARRGVIPPDARLAEGLEQLMRPAF
jgi:signal transduction histidine kinase/CheY-like chemotaxis protein